MKHSNKRPINGDVIQAHLERMGMSAAQASVQMGFSEAYLAQCFKRRWMPEYACRLIKARFGIDYEQYKREEPVSQPEEKSDSLDLILEELRTIRAELQSIRKEFQ